MKLIKEILFVALICCLSETTTAQYIQVDDTYTAQQLVEDVLVNSPCANVANFTVQGDTFSSGQQSYGYFNAAGSSFPFANGIVLSTSRANRVAGPNSNLIDEGSTSWLGDADLEQALGISGSVNATYLEFDFTPLTSQISFDYIFSSEEYHDNASCRYSDGFAFLLKEAGSADQYQNLALVPNTTTPVKVTSVHPQIGGNNGCPAINEEYFDAFNGTEHPTNFNGQTVVMTAKATVIPGTTYHIKLVIADEGNYRYDSAIFLGGGSFKVGTDLGPDKLIATQNPVCAGNSYDLDATEPGINTYKWFKDNVEIPETNPIYTVTDSGVYRVEIALNGSACIATGEVTIEYADLPVLNDPTTLVQCDDDNDGISIFDLTTIDSIITIGNPELSGVTYYESLADAQNEINEITNPEAYQNATTSQIFAKVTNSFGCASYATVNLEISNNGINPQDPVSKCDTDDNQDGFSNFDLAAEVTPQILSGLPAGLLVEYYLTESEAVLQNNPLSNDFNNTIANQQTLYARIVNGADCYGITPITLVVYTFTPANFEDETIYLCDDTKTLAIASGYSSYTWSNGDADYSTNVSVAGNYTVTVTNANSCSATKKFIVIDSGTAVVTSIDIHDFSGNENTVLINYSGMGNYEFSLDGIHFQDSPLFTDVAVGDYWVSVRDKYGCGTTPPIHIYVLDYPKYFTPNGDGVNDIWSIPFLNFQPKSEITIFDRYGKLIYNFRGNSLGWNGEFNSQDLPSSDYWFVIALQNGRIIKGHFTLKR